MENKAFIIKAVADNTDSVSSKLHPSYPSRFFSILGKTYSIKNVLLILGRDTSLYGYLRKPIDNKILNIIKKHKIHKVPNYWPIVALIHMDRILSDRKLLDGIIGLEIDPEQEIKVEIYNTIKQGIVEVHNRDKKLKNLENIIADQITFLLSKILDEKGIKKPSELSLDEYKSIKQEIKSEYFDDIASVVEGNILETITEIDNKKLKEEYLK